MHKQPKKEDFEAKMQDLDAQITKLRDQIQDAKTKYTTTIEGGKMDNSNQTYGEYITEKIEKIKKLKSHKRSVQDKFNDVNQNLNMAREQLDFHQKQMPPYVKNLQDVEDKIKEKQKRYETSTMSAKDEKEIIAEIDKLKKARPSAGKITELKAKIDKYN
jgi:chromosome segregation ATPase